MPAPGAPVAVTDRAVIVGAGLAALYAALALAPRGVVIVSPARARRTTTREPARRARSKRSHAR